jgi:predicted glycosyltransferase
MWGLLFFTFKTFKLVIKYKPDIYLSHGSMYAAFAAFLLRRPHISFEDTFNMEQVLLYKPFTKVILTGNYQHPLKSEKVIRYAGYHELAYLHPNRFSPDRSVLNEIGVEDGEKYVIFRFVSWNASHDYGHSGISFKNKINAVSEYSKYARVFISSEKQLPEELEKYRITISPHRMHDAIAFASLVIGESFTMLSEAAVLGTPAILIHNTPCFYLNELEHKYGLASSFSESFEDQLYAIMKGLHILQHSYFKEELKQKREQMLADKIDVTAFLVWFIKNYPQSKKIMKENPDYQYNFK